MSKRFSNIDISNLLILLFLSIAYLPSQSQYYIKILGYKADTLYPKLKNASSIEKMHLFNQLAFYHSLSDADSALFYANQAMHLAEKFENQSELGSAYRHMGNAYTVSGNYREAVSYLHRALNIFIELDESRKLAELYFDLGKLNYDLEDYEKALFYANKYLELEELESVRGDSVASPFEKAVIIGIIAGAAREAKDYPLAIQYFKEYIELSQTLNIPVSLNTVYLKSLAETYEYIGELDSALKYTYIARGILAQNQGKSLEEQSVYERSIGGIFVKQGFPDKALPLLKKSYSDQCSAGSFYYAAFTAIEIGDIYLDKGFMDSAYTWFSKSNDDASKVYLNIKKDSANERPQTVFVGYQVMFNISHVEVLQRYYRLMLNVHHGLYRFYKALGTYDKALEHHEKKYNYKDSLNRAVTNLEERKTQARFESERMEQQLVLMEQETELAKTGIRQTRMYLFGISGFLVAILFMVLLYLRQNRLKAEQDKIVLQQQLFRSQMNPHFLYNSLASIQNFIVTEDPDNASIYLSRFSSLVRSILDSSNEEFVTIDKEIRLVENYLALQKVRFPDKFDYHVDIDIDIDIENAMIPPMLAQPFIENAIEHGIKHKKGKGRIYIRIERSIEQLNNRTIEKTIFEIEDDGVGREKARDFLLKQEETHTSLATVITRKRIAALNKKLKHKIIMEIIDLKDDEGKARGTLVRFVI